jgi:hypothetical protein
VADFFNDPNIVAFADALPDLIARGLMGRTVLFHGGALAGDFETWSEALGAGYQRFGLEGFIVQQVKQPDADRWVRWLADRRGVEVEYASWIDLLREAVSG